MPVGAIILCGGRATRMGGVDKPLVVWRDRPLVAHVLDRVRPQVDHVVISANRNLDRYRAYGAPVVVDADSGARGGPLAGLWAGLEHVDATHVLLCPGDCPLLPTDLVERLAAALDATSATTAYPHDGVRPQPLPFLGRVHELRALRATLARPGAVMALHARMGGVPVDFSDQPAAFESFNTPADLNRQR